jgi:hypothetical protein
MENTCRITVTRSRIATGLVAIPKELTLMFPSIETEILVWLDVKQAPHKKKFAPHTSSTKECRIYGMSGWYRANHVRPGDHLLIEKLSEREELYLLTLQRLEQSTPEFASEETPLMLGCDTLEPPPRMRAVIQRVVRDTAKARRLKRLYGYRCQLCGVRFPVARESYAIEVHHLRPLGADHSGIDDFGNMVVLCPNHHALFDYGVPQFLGSNLV